MRGSKWRNNLLHACKTGKNNTSVGPIDKSKQGHCIYFVDQSQISKQINVVSTLSNCLYLLSHVKLYRYAIISRPLWDNLKRKLRHDPYQSFNLVCWYFLCRVLLYHVFRAHISLTQISSDFMRKHKLYCQILLCKKKPKSSIMLTLKFSRYYILALHSRILDGNLKYINTLRTCYWPLEMLGITKKKTAQ